MPKKHTTTGKQPATPAIRNGKETLDLEVHVPSLLNRIANKLGHGASAQFRDQFGVGITDWRVIALLAIESDITANRIVEVIGLNKSVVSRCLQRLQANKLVSIRASKEDGRSNVNALTLAGESLHDKILPVALERERRLLKTLSLQEFGELVALLNRLHAALPEVDSAQAEKNPG